MPPPAGPVAAAGPGHRHLARALAAAGTDALAYPDLAALERAVADGAPIPAVVLATVGHATQETAGQAHGGTTDTGQELPWLKPRGCLAWCSGG